MNEGILKDEGVRTSHVSKHSATSGNSVERVTFRKERPVYRYEQLRRKTFYMPTPDDDVTDDVRINKHIVYTCK